MKTIKSHPRPGQSLQQICEKYLTMILENIIVSSQLITNAPKNRLIFDHRTKTHLRKKNQKDNRRCRKLLRNKPFLFSAAFFLLIRFCFNFFPLFLFPSLIFIKYFVIIETSRQRLTSVQDWPASNFSPSPSQNRGTQKSVRQDGLLLFENGLKWESFCGRV